MGQSSRTADPSVPSEAAGHGRPVATTADDLPAEPLNLFEALREVAQWREAREEEITHRISVLDDEVQVLYDQMRALDEQVAQLRRQRDALDADRTALDVEEGARARAAFRAGAAVDRAIMEARAETLKVLDGAAPAAEDAEIEQILDEARQLEGVGPDDLPDAYRRAITERREAVHRRLRLAAREALPERVRVSVVTSVEPPQGIPRVLVVVLPVDFDVYLRWNSRGADLCTQLAWRIVGHLAGMARDLGAPDALFRYIAFEGQLAVQVWFGGVVLPNDLRASWERRFERLCREASEIDAANVELLAAWVDPGLLRPDQDEVARDHP